MPRVLLYDNLKLAVLERQGEAIRFHPTLLAFAAHYRFEPRPVAVARGNEKGRVERTIRYVRDNFFAARPWINLDDLNAQAASWCDGQAANRPCPEDTSLSVREVFAQEQSKLFALPDNPYPIDERKEVRVGKTPYVRFDLNDYSVPHQYVHRVLTVIAKADQITITDGSQVIAQHARSYDKGKQIENEEHIKALADAKYNARQHHGQNRLAQAIPASQALLIAAIERGYSLRSIVADLLQLLDSYGATVTTNKPFTEWGEIFPNAACVVSLIDRLVHNSEIIGIEAESYRLKEAKEQALKRREIRAKRTAKNPHKNQKLIDSNISQ